MRNIQILDDTVCISLCADGRGSIDLFIPPVIGKIVEQNDFFSLSIGISLREEIKTSCTPL